MGKTATKRDKAPSPESSDEIHMKVTLGSNGRLVIPAKVRERLGLKEGDRFSLRATPEGIVLKTPDMALTTLQNLMAKSRRPGESVVDEFIREKRAEAARE